MSIDRTKTKPKEKLPPDGLRILVYTGPGPAKGRPGIAPGAVATDQVPPMSRRAGNRYEVVHVWHERNAAGVLVPVLCYACGAVWTGLWLDVRDEADNVTVIPEIDSGGMIRTARGWVACQCDVGKKSSRRRGIPEATGAEMNAAVQRDLEDAKAAEAAIREHGSGPKWLEAETGAALARTGLVPPPPALRMDRPAPAHQASPEAPGSTIPPKPDVRARAAGDRSLEDDFVI